MTEFLGPPKVHAQGKRFMSLTQPQPHGALRVTYWILQGTQEVGLLSTPAPRTGKLGGSRPSGSLGSCSAEGVLQAQAPGTLSPRARSGPLSAEGRGGAPHGEGRGRRGAG